MKFINVSLVRHSTSNIVNVQTLIYLLAHHKTSLVVLTTQTTIMDVQFMMIVFCSCFLLAVSCAWVPEKILSSSGGYRERGKTFHVENDDDDIFAADDQPRKRREISGGESRTIGPWPTYDVDGGGNIQWANPLKPVGNDIINTKKIEPSEPTTTSVVSDPVVFTKPTPRGPINCNPYDSCASRCDERYRFIEPKGAGYVCNCDDLCVMYGDCCADYVYYCVTMFKEENERDLETSTINDFFLNIFVPFDGGESPVKTTPPISPTIVPTTAPPRKQPELSESRPDNFDCVDIDEFPQGSFWARTRCDPKWDHLDTAALCHATKMDGILSKLPVEGSDGFTYRNLYCAQCNYVPSHLVYWISVSACFQPPPENITTDPDCLAHYLNEHCKTVFQIPKDSAAPPRSCVPSIDTCDREDANSDLGYLHWRQGCLEGYQSLVLGQLIKSDTEVYKNLNCALCNGVDLTRVSCAYPEIELLELKTGEHFEQSAFEPTGKYSGPPSLRAGEDINLIPYAVITNYNEDGDENTVIVDTKSGAVVPIPQHCEEGMVFDPYLGECRQVYCAEGFNLIGNECVREIIPAVPTCASCYDDGPNNRTDEDEITITIGISVTVQIDSDTTPSPELKDDFIDLIANWFNVTEWNYTNPEDPHEFNVSFWTVAEANLTTNALNFVKFTLLLEHMGTNTTFTNLTRFTGDLVSFNVFNVQVMVDGKTIDVDWSDFNRFVDALRGNLIPLKLFFTACGNNGNSTLYLSEEVTFLESGDCPVAYVPEKNRQYNCREMLMLNYDPGIDINQQNFSIITCEGMPTLEHSCVRIRLNASEYILHPNGSIVVISSGELYNPKEYLVIGDSVEVCTTFTTFIKEIYVVDFEFTHLQWILINIGCSISMCGLLMTFVTYTLFAELRTLPGINLMTLIVILFTNNLLMLTGVKDTGNPRVCTAVAILVHFFNLSGFFWMNVMTYDVYKTFGRKRTLKNSLLNKIAPLRQYARYAVYAWGCPTIIVTISVIIDFCNCTRFKMGYGQYFSCTISHPGAYIAMFGVPLVFTLSANVAMFVRTVCVLRKSRESVEVARKSIKNRNSQSDTMLAIKMSTVMGFSWIFGTAAAFLNGAVLWYIFIILNSLQGTFIACTFVFNRRVYHMYEKRFCKKRVRSRARARTLRNHATFTTSTSSSSCGSSVLSRISTSTTLNSSASVVDRRLSSILDSIPDADDADTSHGEDNEAVEVVHQIVDGGDEHDDDDDEVFDDVTSVADVYVRVVGIDGQRTDRLTMTQEETIKVVPKTTNNNVAVFTDAPSVKDDCVHSTDAEVQDNDNPSIGKECEESAKVAHKNIDNEVEERVDDDIPVVDVDVEDNENIPIEIEGFGNATAVVEDDVVGLGVENFVNIKEDVVVDSLDVVNAKEDAEVVGLDDDNVVNIEDIVDGPDFENVVDIKEDVVVSNLGMKDNEDDDSDTVSRVSEGAISSCSNSSQDDATKC